MKQLDNPDYLKRCPPCGEKKLAEPNFYKNKQSLDGYFCYCKKCKSQKDREYKSSPRGKTLTYLNWKIWREHNRDRVRANNRKATRKYIEKNKDLIREKGTERHHLSKLKLIRMIETARPQTLWEKYSVEFPSYQDTAPGLSRR